MSLNASEKKYTAILAAIYAFRLLGLFLIFPVFSLYATHLIGTTPFLIGLALGVYGLVQACLQIPLGMLSDHIGRKPVIIAGLFIFLIGSLVAAVSNTITGVLIGRALQGAGAIGSTLTALLADVTREENRTKAMSLIGMTIAMAFVFAMMVAPLLDHLFGVPGIFVLTAMLALVGIMMTFGFLPTLQQVRKHREAEVEGDQLWTILGSPSLFPLNAGIFCLHAILTATFIAVPLVLGQSLGFSLNQQGLLYVVVLAFAFLAVFPLIIISERRAKIKQVMLVMILLLCVTEFLFAKLALPLSTLGILLFLFFTAFIFLEASLPSWVSKVAPVSKRGTAMGIYSTFQFLGIFVGGALGGWVYHQGGLTHLFIFSMILGIVWLIITFFLTAPKRLASKLLATGALSENEARGLEAELAKIQGVAEVVVIAQDRCAYLKIDRNVPGLEEKLAVFIKARKN